MAAADRSSVAGRYSGCDLYQQGGQGNGHAAHDHAADQRARHVDRHLPRAVQPAAARALEAGESDVDLPDPRHARPALGNQAADEAVQGRRRALSGQANAVVHRGRQGRRLAPEHGRSAQRGRPQKGRAVPAVRRAMPARGRGRFRRTDAAQLRVAARQRRGARALPAALSPHHDRRVSGHQQAAVRVDQDAVGRDRRGPVQARRQQRDRGRRRRPEHLCVSRCAGRQHG